MNNNYKLIKELSYFFGIDNINNIDNRCSVFIKLFILKDHNYDINNCMMAQNYNNNVANPNDLDHNIVDFIIETAINHTNYNNYKNLLIDNIYNKWWTLDERARHFYLKYINVDHIDKNNMLQLVNENNFIKLDKNDKNIRVSLRCIRLSNLNGPLFMSFIPKISNEIFNDIWYTDKHNKLVNVKYGKWANIADSDDILKMLYCYIYNNTSSNLISNLFPNVPVDINDNSSFHKKMFDISIDNLIKNININKNKYKQCNQYGGDGDQKGKDIWIIWERIISDLISDLKIKYKKTLNEDISDSKTPAILLFELHNIVNKLTEIREYLEDYKAYVHLFKDYNEEIIDFEKISDYVDEYRELQNKKSNYETQVKNLITELVDEHEKKVKYEDI